MPVSAAAVKYSAPRKCPLFWKNLPVNSTAGLIMLSLLSFFAFLD